MLKKYICRKVKILEKMRESFKEEKLTNLGTWTIIVNMGVHCKYLNARSECNDIIICVYSHYPLYPNAKSSDIKCVTLSIRWFCIRIERVMTVYRNYDVIAFKSCIQIFTVRITMIYGNPKYCVKWYCVHWALCSNNQF